MSKSKSAGRMRQVVIVALVISALVVFARFVAPHLQDMKPTAPVCVDAPRPYPC